MEEREIVMKKLISLVGVGLLTATMTLSASANTVFSGKTDKEFNQTSHNILSELPKQKKVEVITSIMVIGVKEAASIFEREGYAGEVSVKDVKKMQLQHGPEITKKVRLILEGKTPGEVVALASSGEYEEARRVMGQQIKK